MKIHRIDDLLSALPQLDAFLWTGDNHIELGQFLDHSHFPVSRKAGVVELRTTEGGRSVTVSPLQFIVRSPSGELQVMDRTPFHQEYFSGEIFLGLMRFLFKLSHATMQDLSLQISRCNEPDLAELLRDCVD